MHDFTKILKEELICALGCTEPIAVALAAARAKQVLEATPVACHVHCSGNIIKNVKGVYVPNSDGMKGIEAAVALGLSGGDPDLGLEVLSQVGPKEIAEAKAMLAAKTIQVHLKEGVPNLDIEIELTDEAGHEVLVEIVNKHNNFVRIIKDGQELVKAQPLVQSTGSATPMTMAAIMDYADQVDLQEIRDNLEQQIKMNQAISEEGLKDDYGSSIGKLLLDERADIRTRARAKAAAGSDARMGGCALPVVINAGSGNQGITCSIPVLEYAKDWHKSEEETMRALLVSNLTALHIKQYIGRLSAFCGVTSAGAAAGAGIAYLDDPSNRKLVCDTVGNTLMIVSGMVCDGAKPSCAAKIASAVDAGITGYEMAKAGRNFEPGDGLLKEDIEETIRSIGRLGCEGMKETDIAVLNMMIED